MRLIERAVCGCCLAAAGTAACGSAGAAVPAAAKRLYCSLWLVGLVVLFAGCGRTSADRSDDGRLPVFAGIPPLAYLVEQIGGPHVAVEVLVQSGQDPHTFDPTPRQVLALSRAKLFFEIGMPFENALLAKLRQNTPQMTVVDVAAGVEKRTMDRPCFKHEHDHSDHRGTPDPHVWLSPPLLKIQAENVAAALVRADPAHADDYERNLTALLGRIDATNRRIERMLAPYRGRSFFVFHPGFGYFADTYGLKEEAIEAGGRSPAAKQLKALIERARAEGAKTVFVQPQFDPHGARTIAEAIGGQIVPIDGLAKDVLHNLENIAAKIERSFARLAPASTPGLRER